MAETMFVFEYKRKDGLRVRATVKGNVISLVALNPQGQAVDSWDGLQRLTPVRFEVAEWGKTYANSQVYGSLARR